MNQLECGFVSATLEIKWVKNGESLALDGGLDCWGAVKLSYALLDGLNLPQPPQRSACDVVASIESTIENYEPCKRSNGAIFICSDNNGMDDHVGRVIGDYAWHCVGNIKKPEDVQIHKLDVIERQRQIVGGSVRYVRPKKGVCIEISEDVRLQIASEYGLEKLLKQEL